MAGLPPFVCSAWVVAPRAPSDCQQHACCSSRVCWVLTIIRRKRISCFERTTFCGFNGSATTRQWVAFHSKQAVERHAADAACQLTAATFMLYSSKRALTTRLAKKRGGDADQSADYRSVHRTTTSCKRACCSRFSTRRPNRLPRQCRACSRALSSAAQRAEAASFQALPLCSFFYRFGHRGPARWRPRRCMRCTSQSGLKMCMRSV